MKIRNKRLVTAIVTVFVLAVLAGGAFAFVAQGPLLFQGTAAVDANLNVHISKWGTAPFDDPHGMFSQYTVLSDDYVHINEPTHEAHRITFSADFNAPWQLVNFLFSIKNDGTMDARFVDINFRMKSIDGIPAEDHPNYAALTEAVEYSVMAYFGSYPGEWTGAFFLDRGTILQPGQEEEIWFRMFFDPIPESYGISRLSASVEFELEITYTFAD